MSAFQRTQRRFVCQGVNVTKAFDDLPPGKYGLLQNVRSYVQGEITARNGLTAVGGAVSGAIHTIERFDDSTPFAINPHLVVMGTVDGNLSAGAIAGPFGVIDNGYSGNPLSMVSETPPSSPQPWLYIADSSQYHKIDANNHVFGVGLAPPVAAPDLRNAVGKLGINIIAQFAAFGGPLWVSVGTGASPLGAPVVRTGTTISQIIYDPLSATGPGYASIVPVDFTGIGDGELLFFLQGGNQEVSPITQVTIAVAATTIAGILYDSGTTGLCTIQPAASLGVGQLDAPSQADYIARSNASGGDFAVPRGSGAGLPPSPDTAPSLAKIRQVDFPVNCLVSLGGSETVRILSVALGPDGVQSFRALTNNPHVAGENITGLAAFRCYLNATYTGGAAISDVALTNTITAPPPVPATATPTTTAGVRTAAGQPPLNLALINGRATLPEDDVHLAIRIDHATAVQTIRLYLSVEATAGSAPSAGDFTQDYYFFEWRATDIAAALQNQNADVIASLQAVRPVVVSNAQLNQIGHSQLPAANQPGASLGTAASSTIAAGNLQWLELRCKISDLQRIGTDPSKTLANVTAAEVIVNITGLTPVTINYDAVWISGGFGPDVEAVGTPIVYRARYRSSLTGAVSNPSPASRAGVIPRRQRVTPTITPSADPQADLIDWFRLGNTLTAWTYVGTTQNASGLITDDYPDEQISGGPPLSFTEFQPWPTQDRPRVGTCNVVGSAIQWVSGDQFNTAWAPGSVIIVNNKPYTLYAQPSSATRLFINENAGVATGANFTLTNPTVMGQPLGSVWGGPVQGSTFIFACRDAINPGTVHWTNGNDSESSQEANSLDVTPATEPLQNGFIYDGLPFVASTDNFYALEPTFGSASSFQPQITPCGRGFWTPWAFAVGPEGCYFLAKDGIYLSAGGVAELITDDDLYPLFPHDGAPGIAANGYFPPDMTQTARLRLSWNDGWLYFDYVDTQGTARTLGYRRADKSWWPDLYGDLGVRCRSTEAPGQSVHQMYMGVGSQLAVPGGVLDLAEPMACQVEIVDNQGDARRQKLYRDFMVDASQTAPLSITLGFTNNGTVLPTIAVPAGAGRFQYPLSTGLQQTGVYGSNITALMAWTPSVAGVTTLFAWDLAFQPGPELSTNWLSGPTTHGFRGFQQVPRVRIAYISNAAATFSVIADGALYTYNLPSSGGLYTKTELVLQAVKAMSFQYGLTGPAFQLFDSDFEALVQPWGEGGGYQHVRPF